MKINNLTQSFSFILGVIALVFFVGCSSKILSENQANPSPTPENCEVFSGEWFSSTFKNIEDESRMICDGKPCIDRRYQSSFADVRIICADGKITGEKVLAWSTEGIISNIAVPNKTPFVPQAMTTPLKDGRVENDILYFSYTFDSLVEENCLNEINLKPKGNLLVGTYKISGCVNKKTGLSNTAKELFRLKSKQGGIVLEKL